MRVLRSLAGAVIVSMALTAAVQWLLDRSVVSYLIRRIAWALTPWRDIDSWLQDEHVVRALWWSPESSLEPSLLVVPIVGGLMVGGLGLLLAFTAVFGLYRVAGWPRYTGVSWTRVYRDALTAFAWRAVWVLPATTAVSAVLVKIGWCLIRASYPLVARQGLDGYPWFVVAATVLLAANVAARAIRRQAAYVIPPEEQRCQTCGYLLSGLASARCPECGAPFQGVQAARLELGSLTRLRRRLKRILAVGLPVVLLLMPIWLALLVLTVPIAWKPRGLAPGSQFSWFWGSVWQLRGPLPVSPAYAYHAWIMRRGPARVIAYADFTREYSPEVRWAYWRAPAATGVPPQQCDKVELRPGIALVQGPDGFYFFVSEGQGNARWLMACFAERDLIIERVPLSEVADELAYCDEPPASPPPSAPTTRGAP